MPRRERVSTASTRRRWLRAIQGFLQRGDLGGLPLHDGGGAVVDEQRAAERDEAHQSGEQRDEAIHHTHPVMGLQPGAERVAAEHVSCRCRRRPWVARPSALEQIEALLEVSARTATTRCPTSPVSAVSVIRNGKIETSTSRWPRSSAASMHGVDLVDLRVGHGVAADGGAAAMHHQRTNRCGLSSWSKALGKPMLNARWCREFGLSCAARHPVEALGRLPVALGELGSEPARDSCRSRIAAEQRIAVSPARCIHSSSSCSRLKMRT